MRSVRRIASPIVTGCASGGATGSAGRVVTTAGGVEIRYDSLVLATGSVNNYFGNAPLAEHTIGMKSLPEAMRLRNHVLSCLERAAKASSAEERAAWLTFVVVGGGPTGVEYAGALAELLGIVLGADYPELDRRHARIVLVEGLDRLLSAFHPKLGAYAERSLRKRGVEVVTGTLVDKADDASVVLSNGVTIPAHTVVWSAGVGRVVVMGRCRCAATVPSASAAAVAFGRTRCGDGGWRGGQAFSPAGRPVGAARRGR